MPDDAPRHLTKIRDKDGVIELKWWTPNGDDRDTGEFVCKDKPTEDFIAAMQDLGNVLVARLRPLEIPLDRLTVTTISLSETKGGTLGVIISGSCRTDAGAFAINTPRLTQPKTAEGEDDVDGPATLTPDEWGKVAELARLAHLYHGGDRVQRSLGLDDGGDSGEDEGDQPKLAVG